MFNYTKYNLNKLEGIFKDLGYRIRYERGNFQAGHCLVQQQNMVVINKFYDVEAKINALLEILDQIEVEAEKLSASSSKFYHKILNSGQWTVISK